MSSTGCIPGIQPPATSCSARSIYELNRLHPRDTATRDILLRSLIGHMGCNVVILSPFFCDYGTQISIGDDTYINFNLTVLDGSAAMSPSSPE